MSTLSQREFRDRERHRSSRVFILTLKSYSFSNLIHTTEHTTKSNQQYLCRVRERVRTVTTTVMTVRRWFVRCRVAGVSRVVHGDRTGVTTSAYSSQYGTR